MLVVGRSGAATRKALQVGRGRQEWRWWRRGKRAWKESSGKHRERSFIYSQSCWDRAEEPRSGAREGRSNLWVADLQGMYSKVRCRNTFNRVINCSPSNKELKAWSGRLNLPFAPKTLGKRVGEERESAVLEEICFPSKCAGRWQYASLLSQQGCTCSVLCFCLGPY